MLQPRAASIFVPSLALAAIAAAPCGCTGQIGDGPGGAPPGLAGPINPGRVVAHRLNKVEYDNTVRDLVGLDMKPSAMFGFPDDSYVEGFDNNADGLASSPLLLEKLQAASDAIVTRTMDVSAGNGAVRSKLMSCDPAKLGDSACATQILSAFASRAFRRPITAQEIAGYLGLIDVARSVGDGFEQGIAQALKAILLSPRFLFRIEANPGAGRVARLDDYELASRLSYFLWSSMPDDRLFQQAAAGALRAPAAVAQEVRRMLQDPKSQALVDNLAGQWLGSRELAVKQVTLADVTFDDELRAAIAREASLFLGELMTGDHAIEELLGTDFVLANARLGAHYGLPGAAALGTAFSKLALPDARRSAGLLTQANYLTVSSQRDRTSPTRRGKWISENLLCVVVPPPPPQIPALDPPPATAPTTVRERLAQHRAKGSTCNGCHQYIDPMGLAFEHYDAVGRWRDTDAGAAIDATGEVPVTGVPFDGAVSLARAIQGDDRFLDCVVRKLMTYALGRSVIVDPPTAGSAIDDLAGVADVKMRLGSSQGRLAQLIELVATSPAMTMRLGEESP